jgi:acetyl-CoA synthetase
VTSADLRAFASYDRARQAFAWDLPDAYNLAADVSDRHAASRQAAIVRVTRQGSQSASFAELAGASDRLAWSFADAGLGRGSRVAMILPNRVEALVVFLAATKVGATSVILRWEDGAELHERQLQVARPDALVCGGELCEVVEPLSQAPLFVPASARTWERYAAGEHGASDELLGLMADEGRPFPAAAVSRRDPVLVGFTSGTTGLPKGVVQPQQFVRGALPAFQMASDLGPTDDDVFFSNLGFASLGGLRSIVLPAWCFGRTVVACDMGAMEAPDFCAALCEHKVSVAYLMPSTLKELRRAAELTSSFDWSALRVIITTGEVIGPSLQAWVESVLGAVLHPYYGQSEFAALISSCARWYPNRFGSVGRVVPGHDVEVRPGDGAGGDGAGGAEVPGGSDGVLGTLYIPEGDPALFLGYLQAGEPMPTGLTEPYCTDDVVRVDDEGYVFYVGRQGDVIELKSGRVVQSSELEDALGDLPGVLDVAAVRAARDGASGLVLSVAVGAADPGEYDRVMESVRARVQAALPEDAWPDDLALVRSFPRTKLTNKVNRTQLRAWLADTAPDVLCREPFAR